jgi:hypothetical protein
VVRKVERLWNVRDNKIVRHTVYLLVTPRVVVSITECLHVSLFFFFFFFFFFFPDRVSLYSPGCPGTHSVDQADLELRNLPASASQVLGSKACATTAWHFFFFKVSFIYVFYVYGCSVCMCVCMPEEGIKFNL